MKIYVKHRKALQRLRVMQGYTQKAFAKKVGISNVRLCDIENKPQQKVSVSTANNIINALNCEWSDIFELE